MTRTPRSKQRPAAPVDRSVNGRKAGGSGALDNGERLRAIVETAVDGIITIDASGRVESMNPAAERMFGVSAEDCCGRNITMLMPEPFRSEHDSYLARYLETGQRSIIGIGREVVGLRADGTTFPMELAVSEMHLEGRRMFTGIVRDVTERRAAEEKLRRLAALLDDSNDAIKTLDLDGNITDWNPGAERLYGYTRAQALEMNSRELLPRARGAEIAEQIERLRRGEKVPPFETQRVTADGQLVDILCTLTMLKGWHDDPDLVVVTDRDITERKRGEAMLRGSEAKTRAIVEAAVDGIITIDSDGRIESVNRAAEQLFGYRAEELLGRNVNMLMPQPYRDEHDGYVRRYLLTGVKKIIGSGREVIGRRKGGSTFPMDLAISEMLVGDRRMFTGIVRDISERKHIEEELQGQARSVARANEVLQEATSRAERATAAKSEFLANMSHEIRTPMTAILGFTDELLEALRGSEHSAALQTIQRNGQQLLSLINDILDLSKIEGGKMEVDPVPFEPARVFVEVIELMAGRASAAGLELELVGTEALPALVVSDPHRLRQIVLNLVGNAIKFTKDGTVRLEVAHEPSGARPALVIEVVDSGIGMTDEQAARVFDAFAQADGSTTRRFGGSGLGLAISRRLAELLGGELTVRSALGRGSTFRLRLPYRGVEGEEAEAVFQARHEAEEGPFDVADTLTGLRLLLAEDGRDNQRLIRSLLERAGAEVALVDDGLQVIERAAGADAAAFDVILMDMQMPILDGYEAAAELRARGYTGPIVALTAHAMAGDRRRCLDAGCSDYATKPIDRRALIEVLRQQTGRGPLVARDA